jgi:hypothetical protein
MLAVERDELDGTLRRLGIGGGGGGPFDVAAEFGTGRRPEVWFSGKLRGIEACEAEPTDEPASRSGRSIAKFKYEECAAQVGNVGMARRWSNRSRGHVDGILMTIWRCLKDKTFQKPLCCCVCGCLLIKAQAQTGDRLSQREPSLGSIFLVFRPIKAVWATSSIWS